MPKLERQADHMQGAAACDLRTSADVQTHSAGCAPSPRKGVVTRPGAIAICVRLLRQHDISFLELATPMSEPGPKAEPKRTPKRELIRELVRRPGGASSQEIQDALSMTAREVAPPMLHMVDAGMIYRAKRAGMRLRWFGSAAEASAWELAPVSGENVNTTTPREKPALARGKALSKKSGPPDLLRYTAGDSKVAKPLCDAPIDYSRARVTVAPTPAPRYSVGAGEALTGGFSTSRPGVNPLTGKAW